MNIRFLAAALLAALLFSGCGDDPVDPPIPPIDPWPALSAKEDVLYYVQRAYNERNESKYEDVLDEGFVNFLSDGDANNGLPAQWDRQTEVTSINNLFSKTQVPDPNRPGHLLPLVQMIEMDVQYEAGVTWVPVTPMSAPTETWYTTTAYYFFQITVLPEGATENLTFYPDLNSKVQVTVRNNGTDSKPVWKIVEFRDLGAGGSLAQLHTKSPQQVTWGGVKALYR